MISSIYKVEKQNCIRGIVFGYENKEKFPFHVSKNTFKKYVDLLVIEAQFHHILMKDFSTFAYNKI